MALRGYVRKGKPANWLGVKGAVPVASAHEQAQVEKQVVRVFKRRYPKSSAATIPRKRIHRSTPQRAREMAAYRREAHEFVKAAIKRGETCPVVAAIKELREGKLYGQKISARLNEVHHIRGKIGRLLRDQRFWMAISKQGHRWIHNVNPQEAMARGWLAGAGEWNSTKGL